MVKRLYSQNILFYIDSESDFYADPVSAEKFAIAGQYFLNLAIDLDRNSDRWLQNWLNTSYGKADCVVPHDWNDWLSTRTQQSVSINFLAKYTFTNSIPNNYSDSRISSTNTTFTPSASSENLEESIVTAHAEKIEEWSKIIGDYLGDRVKGSVSFNSLRESLNLSPAKIYLGIILSDRFEVKTNEADFYGDFLVMVTSKK